MLGGSLSVSGKVNGDVVSIGGRVIAGGDSVINGDLVVLGSLERDPGAQVRGNTVRGWDLGLGRTGIGRLDGLDALRRLPAKLRLYNWSAGPWGGWGYQPFRFIFSALALMAIGILVVLFIPKQTEQIARTMVKSAPPSLGFGVLTLTVLLLATPVLVVICIGIPVALVLWLAASLAALLGWLTAGLLVGRRVFQGLNAADTPPMLEVATGVAFLSLLSAIPYIGPLFGFLVGCWGIGAVILSRCGTVAYPSPEPSLSSPVSVPTEDLGGEEDPESTLTAGGGRGGEHPDSPEDDESP